MRERWERTRQEALQRDMLPSWYSTRRRRRTLAAAGLAALAMIWAATAVSWNLAPSDTAMVVSITLLGLSIVIILPVVTLLNVATRGSMSLAERLLDERQVAERLRSFTVAHRVMLGVLVLLAAVVLSTDAEEVPMASVALAVVGLFETHMLLPVLVAGWRQPDPPPDEDEEGEDAGA